MAASEMTFGTALDFELKREIASRMLECPSTLEKSPFLEFALTRLASGRWLDRVGFLRPLATRKIADCHNGVAGSFRGAPLHSAQDQACPAAAIQKVLDWPKLIAKAEAAKAPMWPRLQKLPA